MRRRALRRAASRLLLVLLSALLCVAVSAESEPAQVYPVRRDLSFYFNNSDEVILSLRQMLLRRDPTIEVSFTTRTDSMDDIYDVFSELMQFAEAETLSPREGDYLRYQLGGFRLEYSYTEQGGSYRYRVTVIPDYYTTAKQEERVDAAVAEAVAGFGFTDSTTDRQRAEAVYRFVLENVDYDEINGRHSFYKRKNTAYGALINGHATCQGYAVLTYRLMRECGLDCRVVTGMARQLEGGEEFHAWNKVLIDGEWLELDTMWCDRLGTDDYYLKPQLPDHTAD